MFPRGFPWSVGRRTGSSSQRAGPEHVAKASPGRRALKLLPQRLLRLAGRQQHQRRSATARPRKRRTRRRGGPTLPRTRARATPPRPTPPRRARRVTTTPARPCLPPTTRPPIRPRRAARPRTSPRPPTPNRRTHPTKPRATRPTAPMVSPLRWTPRRPRRPTRRRPPCFDPNAIIIAAPVVPADPNASCEPGRQHGFLAADDGGRRHPASASTAAQITGAKTDTATPGRQERQDRRRQGRCGHHGDACRKKKKKSRAKGGGWVPRPPQPTARPPMPRRLPGRSPPSTRARQRPCSAPPPPRRPTSPISARIWARPTGPRRRKRLRPRPMPAAHPQAAKPQADAGATECQGRRLRSRRGCDAGCADHARACRYPRRRHGDGQQRAGGLRRAGAADQYDLG